MTPRRLSAGVLAAAVLAGIWLFLAPPALGGQTSYVVTSGVSMEPRFHTGDLAVVHPEGSYRVGDVAAYHNRMLHTVVMHRIVAISHGHYTFKGDNNSWLDSNGVPNNGIQPRPSWTQLHAGRMAGMTTKMPHRP